MKAGGKLIQADSLDEAWDDVANGFMEFDGADLQLGIECVFQLAIRIIPFWMNLRI